MAGFSRNSEGRAELAGCLLEQVIARPGTSTPTYVYDLGGIAEQGANLVAALGEGDLVAYAVKANSAGRVIDSLMKVGVGADVVSGAELQLVLAIGVPPARVVMSGVAKTDDEIDLAISSGIRSLQLESVEEVQRVQARAHAVGGAARVALRVNPSVAIETHAHVATGHDKAKFGIPSEHIQDAMAAVDAAAELTLIGLSTHVGSTLMEPEPYLRAAAVVCRLARSRREAGKSLQYVDFGGGFGIDYGVGTPKPPADFARAAKALLREQELDDHSLIVEPGRSLVGSYGVLVARVLQPKRTKNGRWLMIDAAMNDLIRPALYHARHRIEALDVSPNGEPWQVVGPVCESADDFGAHQVSEAIPRFVVIRDAGAYGYCMSSNYNGRPLPGEIFLRDGSVVHEVVRSEPDQWIQARLRA